jgi:tetratricopeptide (TPR) repeat protein
MDSGRITGKLAQAERLRSGGARIRIVSEMEFRELLGLEVPPEATPKSLTDRQVCAALGIDTRALQRWEHCGLVRAHDGRYDFQDLISLRTVTGLVARGVSPLVIRSSLDALAAFLSGVDRPLAQLNILVSDSGELVAELEEALLTTSGQLEIRFDAHSDGVDQGPLSLASADTRGSDAWIDAGLEHEEAGDLDGAEQAYRRAAALAPNDPAPHFNLGNVLLARGQPRAAAERYAHTVALDPSHARAWFNLAHVHESMKEGAASMTYLRRAIAAEPTFADAHFNLADLAERLGDRETAVAGWEAYIRLDPASEWGAEARRRLRALRKAGSWA